MAKNLSPIPLSNYFELHTDGRTRGHSLTLIKYRSKSEVRRHFFSERVVNRWNTLDQVTMSVKAVNGFKTKLEKEDQRRWAWSLLSLEAVLLMEATAGPVSYLWITCELPTCELQTNKQHGGQYPTDQHASRNSYFMKFRLALTVNDKRKLNYTTCWAIPVECHMPLSCLSKK